MKKYIIIWLLILTGVTLGNIISNKIQSKTTIIVIHKGTKIITENNINEVVKNNLEQISKIITEKLTKNKAITRVILKKSLEKNIPIDIALSLAYVESKFNPKAINKNRSSTDYGLFQLNNKSFPNIDYFNIETNTKYALSYLKELYNKYKSWDAAILLYNAGSYKNVSKISVFHLIKVMDKKSEIDRIIFR